MPGSTPEPIRQRIYEVVAEIVQNPEMQKRLLDLGYTPAAETPAQFTRVVHADIARLDGIAKRLNLKAD